MRIHIALFFIFFFTSNLIAQSNRNLFDYDKEKEKLAVVVQSRNLDSVTIFEKVVLDGFDSKIPFYHYINKRKSKVNYAILLHGLGDSKESWVYPSEPYLEWSQNLTSIKDSLLTLGYSLIIPDAKFHGERNYELDFRPPESLPPILSRNEKDTKLFEILMTSTAKDLRIIMDYVQQFNKVKNQSFGVIGYSMGGNIAILLSNHDERVESVVACVPPINLPGKGIETFDWPDDLVQGQLDITPMKYAINQNTPILLLMGKRDYFTPVEDAERFYNNISINEKELKFFDSGHILPNEYKIDAIRWISLYNKF
ncbi:alpha/beta hydrolase family protein [Winogradskyella vincentii]|uniref:Alpha/beta fold hydrolase n=1 Tax=Winogradskyella vincentii TaxID=2877122 RepID=A0ABS7Y492_9FLAO|nr:alpha/beta fold hydrolase [Winogradskyella vincentii]MCA0153508.1 alpha/beta fold hydrolase [Winogradskyella vincentii]